jgi:GAF domain-containing protein
MTPDEGQALLASIVELGRAVFGAKACSIMAHDVAADELVFAAVAGEGAGTLVGRRLPARTGLAGWVLASEESIAIEDVVSDPRFARDVAQSTGYVPTALAVFPLLHDERVLGVFSVLDRSSSAPVGLADLEVMGRFAGHAAQALAAVQAASAGLGGDDALGRLRTRLERADPARRAAATALIDALDDLLQGTSRG